MIRTIRSETLVSQPPTDHACKYTPIKSCYNGISDVNNKYLYSKKGWDHAGAIDGRDARCRSKTLQKRRKKWAGLAGQPVQFSFGLLSLSPHPSIAPVWVEQVVFVYRSGHLYCSRPADRLITGSSYFNVERGFSTTTPPTL